MPFLPKLESPSLVSPSLLSTFLAFGVVCCLSRSGCRLSK